MNGPDLKIVERSVGGFPSRKVISGMWFNGVYEIEADLEYDLDGTTIWLSMEAYRFDDNVWRVHSVSIDAVTFKVRGVTFTKNVFEDAPDLESWLPDHIAEQFEKHFQNEHEANAEQFAGTR